MPIALFSCRYKRKNNAPHAAAETKFHLEFSAFRNAHNLKINNLVATGNPVRKQVDFLRFILLIFFRVGKWKPVTTLLSVVFVPRVFCAYLW